MKFPRRGFTLIEVLVACAVMAILLVLLLTVTSQVSDTWRRTSTRMQAFEAARSAFESITGNLAQATLNTYWDYDQPQTPTRYERRSELHFLSGPTASIGAGLSATANPGHAVFFQAPTGAVADVNFSNLPYLLNGWGYFIEFGSDSSDVPDFLQSTVAEKYRFRLKEWRIPSERLSLYYYTSGQPNSRATDWIDFSEGSGSRPQTLAENVILLLIIPRSPSDAGNPGDDLTAQTGSVYDSRREASSGSPVWIRLQKNQLPPAVEVIMLAIDEASAQRLADQNGTSRPNVLGGATFSNPTQVENDLETVRNHLNQQKIRFIELRSIVPMRAGRWSHES